MRPFVITTPDGQNLYTWHILPVTLYAKNEKNLLQDPKGTEDSTGHLLDVTATQAFHLLRDDPESRLVISCGFPLDSRAKKLIFNSPR